MIPGWRITRRTIARACKAIGRALSGPGRDARWEALHGRWSEAVPEFARAVYYSLGDITRWRRIGKAVLKFLARFIPGREREPSKMMKLANFRNLTKDADVKKPDSNPPKAAEASSARTRGLSR